ncbi:ATP-binding protein [Oceanithermus sp.]
MYPRYLTPRLERALGRSPAVYLTGARQVGKTTLARQLADQRGMTYYTLDDPAVLEAARTDPVGFVSGLVGPAVIDEVQRSPDLLLAVKMAVDASRTPGRFLLTGSVGLKARSQAAAALVGRAEFLTLRPLAQRELARSGRNLVSELFEQDAGRLARSGAAPDLAARICAGGYPPALDKDEDDRRAWFASYVTALIERDLMSLTRIEYPERALALLRALAAATATPQNVSQLGAELGLRAPTARRYEELFERLFLIERLPAWARNLKKQLTKRPKLVLNDTGLAAYLTNLDCERTREQTQLLGRLAETFVLDELAKQASWLEPEPRRYHYRTRGGAEVDLVLEHPDGRVVGVEVKLAGKLPRRATSGLQALREDVGRNFHLGVVFYSGAQPLPLGERLLALPFSALWA